MGAVALIRPLSQEPGGSLRMRRGCGKMALMSPVNDFRLYHSNALEVLAGIPGVTTDTVTRNGQPALVVVFRDEAHRPQVAQTLTFDPSTSVLVAEGMTAPETAYAAVYSQQRFTAVVPAAVAVAACRAPVRQAGDDGLARQARAVQKEQQRDGGGGQPAQAGGEHAGDRQHAAEYEGAHQHERVIVGEKEWTFHKAAIEREFA